MHDEGYTTPEGFWLPKQLMFPDARTFDELLTFVRPWNHDTMTARSGVVAQPDLLPAPRKIGRNEVGPYCQIDRSQIGGPRFFGCAVIATDQVIEALAGSIVTDDDRLTFKVIAHRRRDGEPDRALVIAEHGHIIGSRWLGYVDPSSVPTLDTPAQAVVA
jgi:hypothetical protein